MQMQGQFPTEVRKINKLNKTVLRSAIPLHSSLFTQTYMHTYNKLFRALFPSWNIQQMPETAKSPETLLLPHSLHIETFGFCGKRNLSHRRLLTTFTTIYLRDLRVYAEGENTYNYEAINRDIWPSQNHPEHLIDPKIAENLRTTS